MLCTRCIILKNNYINRHIHIKRLKILQKTQNSYTYQRQGAIFRDSSTKICKCQHNNLVVTLVHSFFLLFLLLALQPPLGVVFYSRLVGLSLLAYEVS